MTIARALPEGRIFFEFGGPSGIFFADEPLWGFGVGFLTPSKTKITGPGIRPGGGKREILEMGKTMEERILLFIPMYNCEKQIARVLGKFTPEVAQVFGEIVVVDNRSSDKSVEVAKTALGKISGTKTVLLQNEENYNLGGSHKVAFNRALALGYDYVVVLHGDDQGGMEDLLPLLERGEHHKYDSLLGSRFARGSKLVGYSKFRTFGNIVFNFGISLVTRSWITDMGAGLNMYKTEYLSSKFYNFFPNDLTFGVFMLLSGIYNKSRYRFFPLTWREDDQVSNARIFRQAFIILGLVWRYFWIPKAIFSRLENEVSKINYGSKVLFESK